MTGNTTVKIWSPPPAFSRAGARRSRRKPLVLRATAILRRPWSTALIIQNESKTLLLGIVKILFPYCMFVVSVWNSTRTHGERPFRFSELPFIVLSFTIQPILVDLSVQPIAQSPIIPQHFDEIAKPDYPRRVPCSRDRVILH